MTTSHPSLSRRRFLGGSAALAVTALLPGHLLAQSFRAPKDLWLSATGDRADTYGLSWYQDGAVKSVASGFRGHGCAWHPARPQQALLIGRRPGLECLLVDLENERTLRRWSTADGYHLNGHAVYSADGLLLFVAESADGSEQGSIAVYDAVLGNLLTRWDTHGLEPHEIRLSPDGSQLIIAHGGLQKDSDGKVLNLASMQSSLTVLDANNGELLGQYLSPVQTASLRHLDVSEQGQVALAAQIQEGATDSTEPAPLAYIWQPGKDSLTALQAPAALITHCHNYMGSVAICNATQTVGFTSPKGDLALFWNLNDGGFKGYHRFHDVCGLTVDRDQKAFVLSNSAGWLRQIRSDDLSDVRDQWQQFDRRWDNHLLTVTS